MTDAHIPTTYGDLLEQADDPALYAAIRAMERGFPRVRPPADLMRRIQASAMAHPVTTTSSRRRSWMGRWFLGGYQSVRQSVTLAVVAALGISLLGGAGYAMHMLGGSPRTHVVQSCTGFGAHWQLAGGGARLMSPPQFVASGGRLIPHWRFQVAGLQRPQYWVTPINADIVDTCSNSSSSQIEIGTNARAHTWLLAISTVPLWESNRPTLVGDLRIPTWGGCTPKTATSPIKAPDGRPVAQLARAPEAFSHSVRVTFTPCNVPKRLVRLPPESHQVGFRILSQVQYQGSAGTVVVLGARPTPAAARPGLNLGNPVGALPDGTRVWDLNCASGTLGGAPCTNDLRWMHGKLIISVTGDLSVNRLKKLAVHVVLK